ncbi:hypothetical protein WwSim0122 [Wolbachia endosymbiont of Drosophila simulans]|nr:hypothetical protein WwSim0122 [Wolbachia endosymbiont of Drosophila simulans]
MAPVTTTVPPGNSLLCTVLPESLDLGSFILLLKHGVSSMSGANLPFDQRLPISTVGCTTSIGPGVWSIIYPIQLFPASVPPICAPFMNTTFSAGEDEDSESIISLRYGVLSVLHFPGSDDAIVES